MTVHVRWHDELERVLRYTFQNDWTSAQLLETARQAAEMIQAKSPYKVHSIVDVSQTNSVPPDFFSHAGFLRSQGQPNSGLIVVVRSPGIFTKVLRLMLPLLPNIRNRVHMVDSIEEAERLIYVAQIATGEVAAPDHWSQVTG